jgi:hypothetical protein
MNAAHTAADSSAPALTDAAISAIVRSLVPLQALTGAVRALPVSPDRVQSTPTADRGSSDGAHDSGMLARARVLHARLQRVPVVERVTLEWLVTYAHTDAHPDTLGDLLASASAFGLRDAVETAKMRRAGAERDRQRLEIETAHARQRLRHGASLLTDATVTERLARAHAVETTMKAREAEAAAMLTRWGREKIAAACAAWQGAGHE